jgi:hypothetical protein
MFYARRRGNSLPMVVLLCTLIIMPYFIRRYGVSIPAFPGGGEADNLTYERYTTFLLPFTFSATGILVEGFLQEIKRRMRFQGIQHKTFVLVAGLLCLTFPVLPLKALSDRYQRAFERGETNAVVLQLVDTSEKMCKSGRAIYLDDDLERVRYEGGGNGLKAFHYFLNLRSVPHAEVRKARLSDPFNNRNDRPVIVITWRDKIRLEQQCDIRLIAEAVPRVDDASQHNGLDIAVFEILKCAD